jgi:hypothetical protein
MKPPPWDEDEGKRLKRAALKRIAERNAAWMAAAKKYVRDYVPWGARVTGEEINRLVVESGIGKPNHHNTWGALVNSLIACGLLVEAKDAKGGKIEVPMRVPRSHARKTTVYVRKGPPWAI